MFPRIPRMICGIAALALSLPHDASAQTLPLASGGQSAYVIYHDASAPPWVKLAAQEMQRVVKLSTGVELPIKHEPTTPMIGLGDNPAARRAGVSPESLPDDGFKIATNAKNIFIVGKDAESQWIGWTSRGTLYGAYEFLERVVGVRWLMPGEVGEDVPKRANLMAPEISLSQSPDFLIRALVDIQDRKRANDPNPQKTVEWLRRNKMPSTSEGRRLDHGHAWQFYVTDAQVKERPDFLALSASTGKPRTFARHAHVKFCTSNEALVQAFAQGVIKWLDEHPTRRGASISPSDGGDFCECPKCQALVTQDAHGRPSYTLLLLSFYNRVGRIVGQKHPDRPLAAYVYYNYVYPPEKTVPMEPNLWLVWAPLNYYGWGLAKPPYRAEFDGVAQRWLALTPNLVYHNYSTWFRSFNGAPIPPGLDILKLELPTLKRHGAKGAEMVGIGAWGYGGPGNYVLAKQLWNASVSVDALYREWLQRAYGPGWQAMDKLYMMIEARLKERKEREQVQYRGEQYEVNYDVIEKVYLPVFDEMEKLYLEALSKAATEPQRKRLEMFGDNLVMLHYGMRKAGMALRDPEKSHFFRADDAYAKFIQDTEFSLALYRDHGKRFTGPVWKGEWRGD